MKKFKTICSAIVAFTVLALAGCDMEVPDSEKVEYLTEIKYDAGVVSKSDGWDDDLVVGFSPMYGTWTLTSTKGETVVVDNEEVKGPEAWWTDRKDSTSTTLADGETVVLELECTTDGTAALAVHCHNGKGWWWYNPGDGNTWAGDGDFTDLKPDFTSTFKTSTRSVSSGKIFKFTIKRNGNDLTWDCYEIKKEGAN